MRKIISLLIIVSPFICNAQQLPQEVQDSLLLIKKGELQWLLEVRADRDVLKKRVVVKDQIIAKQQLDIDSLHKEVKGYKKIDSLNQKKQLVLSQEAVDEKGKALVYQSENRKLKKQNFGLKVFAVVLIGLEIYDKVKK